jgi:hypothetical protein
VKSFRGARILADHGAVKPDAPLLEGIAAYERLAKDLKKLGQHLAYHEEWQQAIRDHAEYFAGRNNVVADVRSWQALRKSAGDPERIKELGDQIRSALSPFQHAQGLNVVTQVDGARVLLATCAGA